ncbi:PREDICTED: uncharacterized protein LOC100632706 isoform X2 [Amphimedon queenslandica]|uniref:AIG1-type G domain-containing protein n=1 Tax=Amphimedon queenslandica TaxID=400682 RepID=A0AAN0J6I4_AMPQE|nr:PREDICTED: uncharacterized protein LOC100632706 isoform X2 [Amphimedon queenslandica]|eukprot:XP_019852650.1 PREDICTED: uncharacterized protein LOC100632706 isoform X2 [Amphimedon queenslandica]
MQSMWRQESSIKVQLNSLKIKIMEELPKKPVGRVKQMTGAFSKAGKTFVNAPRHLLDLQRDASKALESLLRRAWAHQRELRILVTGKTGQGKSTLINGILGAHVAVEGAGAKRCTTHVEMFSKTIKGVPIKVFDSPGLQDRTANEEEYIQGMRETCQELSLVLYCTKMINTRLTDDDKNAMVKLTKGFGESFWNYSVFVLTFANLENVTRKDDRDADEEEPDEDNVEAWKELEKRRFMRRLELWKEELQNFLINEVGVSKKIAVRIPVIPTGDNKKSYDNVEFLRLPDRDNWFNNFWEACCLRVKETRLFLQINSNRMVEKDNGDDDGEEDDNTEEPSTALSPEEEKRDVKEKLETIERFKTARNSFIKLQQKSEEERIPEPMKPRPLMNYQVQHNPTKKKEAPIKMTRTRGASEPDEPPQLAVSNGYSTPRNKTPPPTVSPKPVRRKMKESSYGLPTIPMDALKPGATYIKPMPPPSPSKGSPNHSPTPARITKEASPPSSPPLLQLQSISQNGVPIVDAVQPSEPAVSVSKSVQVTNHLVNQDIHIHPTLVKEVAVETVRRGFSEACADACRAAFDN